LPVWAGEPLVVSEGKAIGRPRTMKIHGYALGMKLRVENGSKEVRFNLELARSIPTTDFESQQ
jgi:hypothetical protein